MEKNNSQKITLGHFLKNRILWKVYFMWFLRRIIPLIALQVAVFALAFRIFASNVFVSRVFSNAARVSERGYLDLLRYMFTAFMNTNPLTQVVILIILGIVSLLIRDLVRMLVTYRSMWIRGDSEAE